MLELGRFGELELQAGKQAGKAGTPGKLERFGKLDKLEISSLGKLEIFKIPQAGNSTRRTSWKIW